MRNSGLGLASMIFMAGVTKHRLSMAGIHTAFAGIIHKWKAIDNGSEIHTGPRSCSGIRIIAFAYSST